MEKVQDIVEKQKRILEIKKAQRKKTVKMDPLMNKTQETFEQ